MAQNIKTVVKIFLLFFTFTILFNLILSVIPTVDPTISTEDQEYITFVQQKLNGKIVGDTETTLEAEARSVLSSITFFFETFQNIFNQNVITSFLGIYQVVVDLISFIANLAMSLLFTPSIIVDILMYNFFANTQTISILSIIINVSFYMTMYYIIFRRVTTQT